MPDLKSDTDKFQKLLIGLQKLSEKPDLHLVNPDDEYVQAVSWYLCCANIDPDRPTTELDIYKDEKVPDEAFSEIVRLFIFSASRNGQAIKTATVNETNQISLFAKPLRDLLLSSDVLKQALEKDNLLTYI